MRSEELSRSQASAGFECCKLTSPWRGWISLSIKHAQGTLMDLLLENSQGTAERFHL